MLPKELKKLLNLSGGKIIVSEGDPQNSYVLMKLDQYLKEMACRDDSIRKNSPQQKLKTPPKDELTDEEILDKINADIAQLRQRQTEKQWSDLLEDDQQEKYDYHFESL